MTSTVADTAVIGVFDDIVAAQKAVQALGAQNVPASAISFVTQGLTVEGRVHGFVTTRDLVGAGAETGAWFGGIFGLLAGAAFVFTPAGPVAVAGALVAPLLAGLEGAGLGGGIGAVTGALFGRFVAKHHIPKIESHLTGGKYLVIVQGDLETVKIGHDVLVGAGAEISEHEAP
jgi:hypothetical protein